MITLPTPRERKVSAWVWRIDELIRERLTKLTHHAVTKGLSSHAAYKPSRVHWIGDVPKTWRIARLTELASLRDDAWGGQPSYSLSRDPKPCTIPCVSFGDLNYLKYNERMREFAGGHPSHWADDPGHLVLPRQAVVLSTVSHAGFCAVLDTPAAVAWPFVAWVPGPEILSDYLLFCLRAMREEIVRLTRPGPLRTLPLRSVRAFRVPVPSLDEQAEIVAHLERAHSHYRAVRERVLTASEKYGGVLCPWESSEKVWYRHGVRFDAESS